MTDKLPYKEVELVEKARQGDIKAFSQLVENYKDMSLSLACSIIKDQSRAEDVLQDTFIKVFRKIKGFKGNSSFSTWLYRIVVNTAYNHLKKSDQIKYVENPIEYDFSTFEAIDFQNLKTEEQKRFINLALSQIPADQALSLRLFYLSEFGLKEIQSITGYSISKIKVDLHRGREQLLFQLKRILGKELKNLL